MPFTPEEIETKAFLVAMRGYDRDEVDAFLRAVAADLRAAEAIREASEPTANTALSENEDALTNAGLMVAEVLHSAVEVADGMRRQAEEARTARVDAAEATALAIERRAQIRADHVLANAQRVLDEAQERAATILEQARDEADYLAAIARERLQVS